MKVRMADPDDTQRIVDLMRHSLGVGNVPRTIPFFRWKHLENPFGPSPILLAEDGGELVGLRAFMRWEFTGGHRAVRAVDTATHPEFRGRGIFKKLTLRLVEQMRSEGVDFVFNTPNDKSGPGYQKMGWKEVGRIPVLVRPGLRWVRRLVSASDPAISDDERGQLVESLAGEQPAAWARLDYAGRGHTPRTSAYLRWRYAEAPGLDYGACWKPDHHLIVFRRRLRRGIHETTLCELLVAPGASAALAALRALARLAVNAEVMTCSAAASARSRRLMYLSGAMRMRGPILMSRELCAPAISGFEHWAWSLGDLELF